MVDIYQCGTLRSFEFFKPSDQHPVKRYLLLHGHFEPDYSLGDSSCRVNPWTGQLLFTSTWCGFFSRRRVDYFKGACDATQSESHFKEKSCAWRAQNNCQTYCLRRQWTTVSYGDVNLDKNKQALSLLVSKLHQQRQSLHVNLETLKVVDEEILSIVQEEWIEDEIREADLVNKLIQLTTATIDNFLETLKTPAKTVDAPKDETPVSSSKVVPSDFLPSNDSVESPVNLPVSAGNVEPSNNLVESPNPTPSLSLPTQKTIPRVKLTKLDLRKFDGEVSTWPTFWDAFESCIHKNPTLAPIDKFNYLETSNKLSIPTWTFFLMLSLWVIKTQEI